MVVCGTLAALGGAYPSATLPILAAAAFIFVLSGARVATHADQRMVDLALFATLVVIALQLVPLPSTWSAAISPAAPPIRAMLRLGPEGGRTPLTVDALETRRALAVGAAAILLFWAARATFTRGGVRRVARIIVTTGFILALVAMAARVTSPRLLLWMWRPEDPGAMPFGPFVNKNHFATWMLMGGALATGYTIAHLRTHFQEMRTRRLVLVAVLADGGALLLLASVFVMTAGLVASGSRSAALGAVSALGLGWWMSPRKGGGAAIPALVLLAVIGAAAWTQSEQLLVRLGTTQSGVGRPTIWRETLPVVRDFWLTGTGAGTYGRAMLRYQQTRTTFFFNTAHNEYLQVLTEGGVLLAVPMVTVLAAGIVAARRQLRDPRHGLFWIRLGAAAGLVAVAVQSIWETGLRIPANALLFAVLAAIVLHERESSGTISTVAA
jgi:putative inorganic carbon (HCO3(-)) transporter